MSSDADPNSAPWIYNAGWGGWLVVGGTSLASPTWAGFMALMNQMRTANRLNPAGFVNPFLYQVVYGVDGSSPLYLKDFHDSLWGITDSRRAPGWDADTGLGTFIALALAETLATSPAAQMSDNYKSEESLA